MLLLVALKKLWGNPDRVKENDADYRTVRAVRQTFSPVVTALGSIKPRIGAEVQLGARISGTVEHLCANIGEKVEKGTGHRGTRKG